MLAFMDSTNGLVDVDTSEKEPKPELRFIPDRYRIASLGINTLAVYSTLRNSFEGEVPSVFRDKGEEYDIRVRLAGVSRQDKDSFSEVMIATPGGIVPASRLGDVVPASGESEIKRKNRTRLIEVTANIGTGALSEYENMITSKRDKMDIPDGYRIALGGDSEAKAEAFASLFQALFMAIVLTYIILAAMLESYVHPVTIMTTLPLGLVGVAIGLFIGKQTINILSLMSVVMLVGIVVNNAILMLDYANVLRDEGKPRREALVEACYTQVSPHRHDEPGDRAGDRPPGHGQRRGRDAEGNGLGHHRRNPDLDGLHPLPDPGHLRILRPVYHAGEAGTGDQIG